MARKPCGSGCKIILKKAVEFSRTVAEEVESMAFIIEKAALFWFFSSRHTHKSARRRLFSPRLSPFALLHPRAAPFIPKIASCGKKKKIRAEEPHPLFFTFLLVLHFFAKRSYLGFFYLIAPHKQAKIMAGAGELPPGFGGMPGGAGGFPGMPGGGGAPFDVDKIRECF